MEKRRILTAATYRGKTGSSFPLFFSISNLIKLNFSLSLSLLSLSLSLSLFLFQYPNVAN